MEAGDAEAFFHMGSDYELGDRGLPQDHNKAMEMWNRGADLGHAGAIIPLLMHIYMARELRKMTKKQNLILSLMPWEGTKWQGTVLA